MPRIYPITAPELDIAECTLRAVLADSISESIYTFEQQVQSYGGERWEMDITTPQLKNADAQEWISFLLKLDGRFGTFLMGDPRSRLPRGRMRDYLAGLSHIQQTNIAVRSNTVQTDVHWASVADIPSNPTTEPMMLAGDFIQIGVGEQARLHKLVENATMQASVAPEVFTMTMDVWPKTRPRVSNFVSVIPSNTKGLWRRNTASNEWVNGVMRYSTISFGCIEAI